ncbi:MAG: hypothetical protein H6739_29430 [Alphaproteobacteria bacterium]|nr:hypothetical protein [Alphaproteobacteria bacterium]
MEGPTAAELESSVRKVLGPALERVEEEVDKVHDELLLKWPVKTGRSRASWFTATTLDPEKYSATASLLSDEKYVVYIKSTKVSGKNDATRNRSPYQELVRRPLRLAQKELRDGDLKDIITRALQREIDRG